MLSTPLICCSMGVATDLLQGLRVRTDVEACS